MPRVSGYVEAVIGEGRGVGGSLGALGIALANQVLNHGSRHSFLRTRKHFQHHALDVPENDPVCLSLLCTPIQSSRPLVHFKVDEFFMRRQHVNLRMVGHPA